MIESSPLSNGDMGDRWREVWCDRCANDHTAHIDEYDPDETCWIFTQLLLDELPIAELTDLNVAGAAWSAGDLVCDRFTPCRDCKR